jgi:hypothetical protein
MQQVRQPSVRSSQDTGSQDARLGPLIFRDGFEALTHICQHMEDLLREGASVPAVVMDGSEMFDPAQAVKRNPDGNQIALLRVASSDGGFMVLATTGGPNGPKLRPGQLVIWRALSHSPAIAQAAFDDRYGWLGIITSTMKPEWRDGRWVGYEQFQP